MARTWVLDTDTKGTGASMVPLEKVEKEAGERSERRASKARKPARRKGAPAGTQAAESRRARSAEASQRTATPLPTGHVRKKATGEIGKVRSVDPKAGTASVHWLKRGSASTVPLSAISRR